ncbi:MAG: UPF0179 family protein [Euryarchaeota archaeon]|nr:UPF0179 family protein [Euryarchaeota archaeon]
MNKKGKEEEMEEGRRVTLIGTKLAKEGDEFIFLGTSNKCEECKLKNTCANLVVGRRYRIEKVRNEMKHDCYIHEDGVCVVEVTEATITAAIEATYAFKNSRIVFEPPNCKEYDCELFCSCHPAGLIEGDKCTILDVIGDAPGECKKGRVLKLVTLRREAI